MNKIIKTAVVLSALALPLGAMAQSAVIDDTTPVTVTAVVSETSGLTIGSLNFGDVLPLHGAQEASSAACVYFNNNAPYEIRAMGNKNINDPGDVNFYMTHTDNAHQLKYILHWKDDNSVNPDEKFQLSNENIFMQNTITNSGFLSNGGADCSTDMAKANATLMGEISAADMNQTIEGTYLDEVVFTVQATV